jgi:hypothetical protein
MFLYTKNTSQKAVFWIIKILSFPLSPLAHHHPEVHGINCAILVKISFGFSGIAPGAHEHSEVLRINVIVGIKISRR